MINLNYLYNGKRAVLKRYPYAQIEARMLQELSAFINVPKVLKVDTNELIIEFIEDNTPFNEIRFAKELARLHKQTHTHFGLAYHTTIGPLFQPNLQNKNWREFFIEKRVLYMAKEAYKENQISSSLLNRLEQFCTKIEKLIPNNIKPSLIHGDIWSGNLISHNHTNYLIDPAIYYAHNEIELAFIKMFNTFSQSFFDSYNEVFPIEKEFFKERYKIYQLYPYLVHVRIYGASYINGVENIIKEFL